MQKESSFKYWKHSGVSTEQTQTRVHWLNKVHSKSSKIMSFQVTQALEDKILAFFLLYAIIVCIRAVSSERSLYL